MKLKNLFLSAVAALLTICLLFLLFIATNEQALAKVHQTISTFSKINKVSAIENVVKVNHLTAHASERTNKQQTQSLTIEANQPHKYTDQECKVIASNYAQQKQQVESHMTKIEETSRDVTYSGTQHDNNIKINKNGKVENDKNTH